MVTRLVTRQHSALVCRAEARIAGTGTYRFREIHHSVRSMLPQHEIHVNSVVQNEHIPGDQDPRIPYLRRIDIYASKRRRFWTLHRHKRTRSISETHERKWRFAQQYSSLLNINTVFWVVLFGLTTIFKTLLNNRVGRIRFRKSVAVPGDFLE